MRPTDRITAYFEACSSGSAEEIASHFTTDAVIWDTNIRPVRGNDTIAAMWLKVRDRWGGAVWTVDSVVESGDGTTAAIEWQMTGNNPTDGRRFVFRGSEHYAFEHSQIAEIRQYWTFDPQRLDTGLIDYRYS
ncbi:MAG: nuclear transport factor 2 family protein [Actinomycetia bacterium]|nr:nuclear transport factor 2 family protein [Actinomycetes bacterium]MCP4959276.1 nuclear transport factor 2 family protein [Actinomycetes bacterium]